MQNEFKMQTNVIQDFKNQTSQGAPSRAPPALRGGPMAVKKQHDMRHVLAAQTKQKIELSDVVMGAGQGQRSRPVAGPANFDKENVNTKNNSELVIISEQEFQNSCARGRQLRPSQSQRAHSAAEDDDISGESNPQMDTHRRVNDQRWLGESQGFRDEDDEDMSDQEDVYPIRDQGETDSVSLICQEKVDTLAEDQIVAQQEVVILGKKDSQIHKNQDESIIQLVSALDVEERDQDGKETAPLGRLPAQSKHEINVQLGKAEAQAHQLESILKQDDHCADHAMVSSPTKPKFTKSASAAPVIADNTMQFIGLINKQQQNNNFQKVDRAQPIQQNQGKKGVAALLRTPSQNKQLKIFRNPVPTHQNMYHMNTQHLHASFGVSSEHANANQPKIESPDLPKVQHRRITMEPIKHDITTNSFSFRRQSPEQQQQDASNNQIYRGTPQRTPQSRLRGFNQSASQRISLAQLSSSPVQKSPFRKRYSLMQSKPTMNNLKDQEDNQSNEPYVRLLSVNSGNSLHNTSNQNHFDQFLGTKGRSKAAYEKSSFDSPERIGSSIKKKPSMKYNYLNQFSNGKIINSNQKSKPFMSQDMKTPIKEQHKTNITPQKINDYQTLQNNQDMAENADDDKRFSSNTTKKFVTRMHGGSIIHSNFKVNHHSVQKNKIRRSDSKSKSKQTNSSQKDIPKVGICRQLQFDNEAPIQSPCFNARDPTSKKFGALNRGGLSTSTANCINMMTTSDRWTGLQMHGVHHQHFLDEKVFQATPFQQSLIQGAHHQRQLYEPVQLGKMMNNRPNLNTSLSPHNNISSIFGLQQAQQMQQYSTRLLNPFGSSGIPRHQSSRKKNKKSKKKQSQAGAGDLYEGAEADESVMPFPYILQPIINIGGQMPGQLKKIYQVSASHVSPDKRNKHAGSSKHNESTSQYFGKHPNEGEKPQHFRAEDDDVQMHELGGETIGAKQRKRQRCNSSSETIKIHGPNESTQKQRVTNNSVITASDRRNQESQGAVSEESSSSDYTDDDDEDESSSSSPKYARSCYKHFQLLQQQQEASAQFFSDSRMRLRLDDGILTAMPPQQPHPLFYQQHLLSEHEQQMAVMDQQHQTIFDCQNAVASPTKIKKATGQGQQHTEKCHNHGRHHHKVKQVCSCCIWQNDNLCSTSNKNDSPITESTGRKHRQKSSLRKQRKREMKEKQSLNSKYAANHYYNSRSPNALASYNHPVAGMMMPHYLGNESQYHQFQAINFMLQPNFLLGNINIVAGMNPHHTGLNQLSHHQMANLAGYSPSVLAHNAPGLALQQLNANAAVNPMGHPQMLFANSFQGPVGNSAKFGSNDEQHWTKKNQGREQATGLTGGKPPKESRQRKNKQSMAGKRRQSASRNLEQEFAEYKAAKHIKISEGTSDPGVIQIKCGNAKSSESKDKVAVVEGLQRQLSYSNAKNEAENELMNEEGMLDDVEENLSSNLDQDDEFEPSIMVSKRIKSSDMNNIDDSEMQESSVFKSPDQQERQRTISRALNEAIGLPSQQKRTKSKSKKRASEEEQTAQQLILQNLQTFNPNFVDEEGLQLPAENQQINPSDQYLPPSHHKKRHANKDDLLQITPDQKSKIEQGNRSQVAASQGFYAQTGQKKASHGVDTLNIKTQSQTRTSGAHGNGNAGNSLMNKMFGFNNQNASADKIQVQKFNQNGLMESLNPVMTSQRNDHEQIRILNPQKETNMQQQPSDDHITVSLSQFNSKKQLLTDQQPAFMNQSSFQNSTVKDYPISAGVNLEKATIFNNSVLALNQTVQGASSRHQRQASSKKPTSIAGSNANLQSTNQGKRLTQQEKELQNHQNEENIRIKTEKIISQTITQQELFAKPMVTQCKGCKCKNTKCLKLYCECLRNNATCGPACQCTRQGGECHNNDEHLMDRKKAVEEILKRNIDAFESKVDSDKNMHFKGCKCKASECQKKYCECFERGVPCTPLCKCSNCKNTHQSFTERRQRLHEGDRCAEHQIIENPGVQTNSGVCCTDPAPGPLNLNEGQPLKPQHNIEVKAEIVTIQDELRENNGENKVIEGQDQQAREKDAEIRQQYQPKEIFTAAKVITKPSEVPERAKDGAGNSIEGNTCGQIDSNVEASKDFAIVPAIRAEQIANPEEVKVTTNIDEKDVAENGHQPQLGNNEGYTPNDQFKYIVFQKEQRPVDRARTEKYQEENVENMNTMNLPVKSGKVQTESAAQQAPVRPVKVEMIKRPTPIRKEIQPQDLSLCDLQQVDWPKKDESDAFGQDQAKKQASQSSLTTSKPVSKSKRLSEKVSKESAKQSKQSKSKSSQPTHISAFMPVHESHSPGLLVEPPAKLQALAPKKAQSSLSATPTHLQQQQSQHSGKRSKPPTAPQEKMQTRHQKKLLLKQRVSDQN